jgi:hypothetical protein
MIMLIFALLSYVFKSLAMYQILQPVSHTTYPEEGILSNNSAFKVRYHN